MMRQVDLRIRYRYRMLIQWCGVYLLSVVAIAGCAAPQQSNQGAQSDMQANKEQRGVPFSGTVTWIDLEGGFWGIVTDSGQKFLPRKLPEALRQDGLKVSGHYRLVKDMMTIQMWGRLIEIVDVQATN